MDSHYPTERNKAMFKTSSSHSKAQEAAEDIFFGQITIIWARWFLIAAGTIIAVLSTVKMSQLIIAILTVIVLMTINFAMHGRYLMGKPANMFLLLATNLVDALIITFLVITWNGAAGLNSQFFILYYPMLFAFALVFPPTIAILYTVLTLILYTTVCLMTTNPQLIYSIAGFELLAMRLITLSAMGGLGTYYYRRQRESLRKLTAKPLTAWK
jgi:hypothetical protein